MGKMPLAGLIGACGLGMLLTGCMHNKQDQNPKPSYMGGKADAHTDFTRPRSKNVSAPDLNSVSSPLDSTSSSGTESTSGLTSSSQGITGSGPVGGTMMPNNTGSTPMSGSSSSLPSNSSSAAPLSANTMTGMGSSSGLTNNGAGALAASAYGGNPSASSPIQKVSNQGDGSTTVKDAAYQVDNNDTTASMPSMPSNSAGRMPLPPPPSMNPYPPTSSASSGSSLSSISAAMPPPPPPPPPSDSTNQLSAPPPQVTSGAPSSLSGMGAPTSTSPSRPSIGPAYLYSPVK